MFARQTVLKFSLNSNAKPSKNALHFGDSGVTIAEHSDSCSAETTVMSIFFPTWSDALLLNGEIRIQNSLAFTKAKK